VKTLYLDIETIPAQNPAVREELAAGITPPGNMSKADTIAAWEKEKKPGLVEEAWRRTSFDGALGQIVVIGYAVDDEVPITLFDRADATKPVPTLADEAKVLKSFFGALGQMNANEAVVTTWCGHNVVDFDLRFIFQRAVIQGIRPPFVIPFNAKPWGDRVFDTMVQWAGAKNRIGLDKLCKVLGVAGKGSELGDEIDGSKVWDFVKDGRIADVATYCAGDVARVREIHKRMTFGGV
jgi:3'-5' exonuclease